MQQFLLKPICVFVKKTFFTITKILSIATLHRNLKAKNNEKIILKSIIILNRTN